jgi:enoyl-CoA hydratase
MEMFTLTRNGHILDVVLDRKDSPLNAVNEQLHEEFAELFRILKREGDARAIVLSARGRGFSAGGDFDWFARLNEPSTLDALRREAKQMIWDLLDIEVPIVCALHGGAVGLGASIALMCDLLVMSDDAVIVDPHVNVGLVAGDGGTAIWPLLVGPIAAKRHLFLGEPLTAAQALRYGIASEVCANDQLLDRAQVWAERIASKAPLAVRGTKLAVNAHLKRALFDSFDLSSALEIPCFYSTDHKEAVAAFREKRTPTFEGR